MKPGRKQSLAALFFLTCVCFTFGSEGNAQESAITPQPVALKKIIAIMPVQQSIQKPVVFLSKKKIKKSIGSKIASALKQLAGASETHTLDQATEKLDQLISKILLEKEYLVIRPEELEKSLGKIKAEEQREFSIQELPAHIHADAFLSVVLTQWDDANYRRTGVIKAGFSSVLIDSATNEPLWSHQASDVALRGLHKQQLLSRRSANAFEGLTREILRGFPE